MSIILGRGMAPAPDGLNLGNDGDWVDIFTTGENSVLNWDSSTSPINPGVGRVAGNSGALSAITQLYISETTLDGYSFRAVFESLIKDDLFSLSKYLVKSNYMICRLTGEAIDNGSWWTIPVVVEDSGGGLDNNDPLFTNLFEVGKPVYGTQYHYEEDEPISSNTTTTYEHKVELTTDVLPLGKYKLDWSFEVTNMSPNKEIEFRLLLNTTTSLNEGQVRLTSADDWLPVSGIKELELSGVNVFDIDFRRGTNGGTAQVRRARLSIIRVE